MTPCQLWSIFRGLKTNFRWMDASWTYTPEMASKETKAIASRGFGIADYAEILRLHRKYRLDPKESLAEVFIRVAHKLEEIDPQ